MARSPSPSKNTQRSRLMALRPDGLTVLSAVIIVLSFPPYDVYPLIWICLVPWFFALRKARDWRQALLQGVWLSFFMTILGFHWVARVLHQYGQVPWAAAILGLLLFGLGGQPQFLLFAPLGSRFLRESRPDRVRWWGAGLSVALALAYAGVDWALPKLWVDTLGHSLYRARNLRQVADLGGAAILTVLVYLVNDLVYRLVLRIRARREPSLLPVVSATGPLAAIVLIVVLASWNYGFFRGRAIRELQASPLATVQAGVIQANIGDFDKVASESGVNGAAEKVLGTFFSLSDQALALSPKPEMLVWPETSYPGTFRTPHEASDLYRDQKLERYVRERGIPLFFGGYDTQGRKDYNAFFFLSPKPLPGVGGEGDLQIYRKSVLLLFGEFIPGAESIKALRDAFPQVGNFGRGPGPSVYDLPTSNPAMPTFKAGPIICYEALFPWFGIGLARKGAQMMINVTNDSWFGTFGEPQLHLALTAFRSIETRIPQLRATNTGISALILPDGEITHQTPLNEPLVMSVPVPILPRVETLIVRWGDWFGLTALLLGLGTLILAARREAR
ncbi:MAG TPA: apolipoprotein N-acyltransferase [Bdellovibrionota bacterium]|nr:apolipoprotein N-acyltransferase [Bdellovibrionota bacterium]